MLRRSFLYRCAAATSQSSTTPAPATTATAAPRIVRVGDTYAIRRTFTREDVATFAKLCGDNNPIHLDDEAAKKLGFPRAIVHGQLVASLFSYILGTYLPGPQSVYVSQGVQFRAPVLVGDEVEARVTVVKFRADKGLIDTETTVTRVRDNVVAISGNSLGMNKVVRLEGATPEWGSKATR